MLIRAERNAMLTTIVTRFRGRWKSNENEVNENVKPDPYVVLRGHQPRVIVRNIKVL